MCVCMCMHVTCVFGSVCMFVYVCVSVCKLMFQILDPSRNRLSAICHIPFDKMFFLKLFFYIMQCHSEIADKNCEPILHVVDE